MAQNDIKLAPNRFQNAEYARQVHTATVEVGTDPANLENPAYWSLIAPRVKPYDKVEVRADDGAYYAEFLVLGCDRTWVKLQKLFEVKLSSSDVSLTQAAMQEPPKADYLVAYKGPLKKWSVIRTSDSAMVHDGDQSRVDSEIWLANHRKVIA